MISLHGRSSSTASISPRPRISFTPATSASDCLQARRAGARRVARRARRVSAARAISITASATRHTSGLPQNVEPCVPGVNTLAAAPRARQAPIGTPLPRRLGERHHVRTDAFVLAGEPFAGAAHAGLDFVQHQQPAALVADLAQAREITRRPECATPPSPVIGSTSTATTSLLFSATCSHGREIVVRHAVEAGAPAVRSRPGSCGCRWRRAWRACGRGSCPR